MQKNSSFFDVYNELQLPKSHSDSFVTLDKVKGHFHFRKVEHCTRGSIHNLADRLNELYDSLYKSLSTEIQSFKAGDYCWAQQICYEVKTMVEGLPKPSEHSFQELNKSICKFHQLHCWLSRLLMHLHDDSGTINCIEQFRSLCREGSTEIIYQFLNSQGLQNEHNAPRYALFLQIACEEGCFSIARACVKKGALVSLKDDGGAAIARYLLLLFEKQPEKINDQEFFPLLEELSEKGVCFHCVSQNKTLLYYACKAGLPRLARLLLDNGVGAIEGRSPLLALLEYAKGNRNLLGFDTDEIEELAINFVQMKLNLQEKDGEKNTLLHLALLCDFENLAVLLISRLQDINSKNSSQKTPLEVALERGHAEIAEQLLRKGAKVRRGYPFTGTSRDCCLHLSPLLAIEVLKQAGMNFKKFGKSLIQAALKMEQFCLAEKIYELLPQRGAVEKNIEKNQFSQSIFYYACKYGAKKLLKRMITAGGAFRAVSSKGQTFLTICLNNSHEDCAEILINAGIDVNQGAPLSPLMIACEKKLKNSVRLLLHHHAEVADEKEGKSALVSLLLGDLPEDDTEEWDTIGVNLLKQSPKFAVPDLALVEAAIEKRFPELAAELLHKLGVPNPLDSHLHSCFLLACRTPHMGNIGRELLEKIKDVNITDRDNATALLCAIWGGDEDLALEILTKGAEANSEVVISNMHQNERESPSSFEDVKTSYFPFFEACSRKMETLSALLAEKVEDVEMSADGKHPLHIACKFGQEEASRKLLQKGGNPFLKTTKGLSCLSFACQGSLEILALELIDLAPDVNEVCLETGRTVLEYSLRHNLPQVAKKLIERGVNVYPGQENSFYREVATCLDIAIEKGYDDIALMLLQKGLYVSRLKTHGPLIHYVAKKGMKNTFEWLLDISSEANLRDEEGRTLVVAALEGNLEDNALQLLERGFSLPTEWRSRTGNTLLHIVLKNCFLKFFKKYKDKFFSCDLFAKNSSHQTALELFLEQEGVMGELKEDLLDEFFGSDFSSVERDVGIALISGHSKMLQERSSHLKNKKEYFEILQKLSKKFPHCNFEKIGRLALYKIDATHLEKAPRLPPLPPKPKDVHIKDLEKFVSFFNFSDASQKGYIDPTKQFSGLTFEQIKKNLSDFSDDVTYRRARLGTPKEGTSELLEFYDKIERATTLTLQALFKLNLQDENNRKFALSVLKEFIDAAPLCGPRVYNTVFEQYYLTLFGQGPTFESALANIFAEFRKGLVRSLVRQDEGHFVHDIDLFVKDYGEMLGLTETQAILSLDDPFMDNEFDTQKLYEDFLEVYTPLAVFDYFHEQLHDESIRSKFIDWQKAHVPANFEKDTQDKDERQYNWIAAISTSDNNYYTMDSILYALEKEKIIRAVVDKEASS
jgi:ankyrin repeat protein